MSEKMGSGKQLQLFTMTKAELEARRKPSAAPRLVHAVYALHVDLWSDEEHPDYQRHLTGYSIEETMEDGKKRRRNTYVTGNRIMDDGVAAAIMQEVAAERHIDIIVKALTNDVAMKIRQVMQSKFDLNRKAIAQIMVERSKGAEKPPVETPPVVDRDVDDEWNAKLAEFMEPVASAGA